MAEGYVFQFAGHCLGDLVKSGTTLSADPEAEIQPLDIVSVILKRIDGPYSELVNSLGAGGHAGIVKLFLCAREMPDGGTVYIVGQLNPPCISPIPASAIEAMHRVDGVALAEAGLLSASDQAALKLLLPFSEGEAVAPVNPGFEPGWPASYFEEFRI